MAGQDGRYRVDFREQLVPNGFFSHHQLSKVQVAMT